MSFFMLSKVFDLFSVFYLFLKNPREDQRRSIFLIENDRENERVLSYILQHFAFQKAIILSCESLFIKQRMLAMFFFDERSKDWNEIKKFFLLLRDGLWKWKKHHFCSCIWTRVGSCMNMKHAGASLSSKYFSKNSRFSEAQFNAFFSRFLIFDKYAKVKKETAFCLMFFFLLFIRGQSRELYTMQMRTRLNDLTNRQKSLQVIGYLWSALFPLKDSIF